MQKEFDERQNLMRFLITQIAGSKDGVLHNHNNMN